MTVVVSSQDVDARDMRGHDEQRVAVVGIGFIGWGGVV